MRCDERLRMALVVLTGGLVTVASGIGPASATGQTLEPPRFAEAPNILQKPGGVPFSDELRHSLRVPRGFTVGVFAAPQGNPRMMAVEEDGTVYVTRQNEGDVLRLRDTDGDGQADDVRTVASGLELVHGIAIYQHVLYLAAPKKVWRAAILPDGDLGERQLIIEDLPDAGQHRARTIAIGRDGLLYIGVGSTCNACPDTNPQNATIQRANLDGSDRHTFATGLRHTVGFDWHPWTGALWGWDNGSDSRGNGVPREELNELVEGGKYGWPFCFEDRRIDPLISEAPKGQTRRAYCDGTRPPALTYTAHSAPLGMTFYTGRQFPSDYQGDAFLALHGSWNRTPVSGYKVVRVRFDGGTPVSVENFLTGFELDRREWAGRTEGSTARSVFGRPAGVVVARDGALLVSDDMNGIIYRIAHQGAPRPGN
jgi:glucose/arabinose dehydrogenase